MRVLSRETTALAFDGFGGTPNRPGRVVIEPGYSTVSEEAAVFLATDPAYQRLVAEKWITENPEGDVEAAEASESFEPLPADPRAQLDGESKTAYAKRMKALGDAALAANKPRVDFLATFNATDKAGQDAVYPTLTPEQRGWVDADRAKGA